MERFRFRRDHRARLDSGKHRFVKRHFARRRFCRAGAAHRSAICEYFAVGAVRLDQKFAFVEPTLLLDKGEFLPEAMKRQRVGESEIRTAIRASGSAAIEEIEAVVLETDGSLSVVKKSSNDSRTALKDVPGKANGK